VSGADSQRMNGASVNKRKIKGGFEKKKEREKKTRA
jgi:hypothetical protein